MNLEISAQTDKGRRRRRNEDRALARIENTSKAVVCLLAVADGVGGAPAGNRASEIAASALSEQALDPEVGPALILREAFEIANRRIIEEAMAKPHRYGMATTLVAALISDANLWVANVGDSRAYLLRDGCLRQLTVDHSMVADRVKAGFLTADEAAASSYRNVVTRSLGMTHSVEADVFDCGALEPQDVVLLCSDGLYNMVPYEAIAECVTTNTPQDAARELIRSANLRGGSDNIAVALAQVCKR